MHLVLRKLESEEGFVWPKLLVGRDLVHCRVYMEDSPKS